MPRRIHDDARAITLDEVLPHYDFSERHHRIIEATVEDTWAALTSLTVAGLTITRPLLALRHLNAVRSSPKPLLTDGPVRLLYRREGERAIAGAIARPWQLRPARQPVPDLATFLEFDDPGWTKYLTDFRVVAGPSSHQCTLSTETRGLSTDARARRRFRLYWTLIRVPSGLIRRDILRSVARAATSGHPIMR